MRKYLYDDNEPVAPKLEKNTSFYNPILTNYFRQKTTYTKIHYPDDSEKILTEFYRSLIIVKESTIIGPNRVKLTTYADGEIIIMPMPPQRREISPSSLFQDIIGKVNLYIDNLNNENALLFNTENSEGNMKIINSIALKWITTINSVHKTEERFMISKYLGLDFIQEGSNICKNYKATCQLNKRLQQLNDLDMIIAKQIDNSSTSFLLIFSNQSPNNFHIGELFSASNYLSINNDYYKENTNAGKSLEIKPNEKYQWPIDFDLEKFKHDKADLLTIKWTLGKINSPLPNIFSEYLFALSNFNESDNLFLTQNDSAMLMIVKLLDEQPLSFVLIVHNITSNEIKLPNFFTENNRVEIFFPDGRIFKAPSKGISDYFSLAPNETKTIKIDLEKLLSESNKYSMDNFNFGISKLTWTMKKSDDEIVEKNFYLAKFDNIDKN